MITYALSGDKQAPKQDSVVYCHQKYIENQTTNQTVTLSHMYVVLETESFGVDMGGASPSVF